MTIKLIALDLDKTTLCSDNHLSAENRETLEAAIEQGVSVVIATGRPKAALPGNVTEIKGIQYAITSNGARVIDLRTGETVYANLIAADAVPPIFDVLRRYDHLVEIFIDGAAYMEKEKWDAVAAGAPIKRSRDYVMNTRLPRKNVLGMMMDNKDKLENINIFYDDLADKEAMHDELAELECVTLTSSFPNNWELGGLTTSKADALIHLGQILDIKKEEMMACGDSPNDIAMLRAAGTAIAMGNAEEEVKAAATYVTASNDDSGVARAVKKFVLKTE